MSYASRQGEFDTGQTLTEVALEAEFDYIYGCLDGTNTIDAKIQGDLEVQGGDITVSNAATDLDVIDNNSSALSIDSSGQAGILEIDSTTDATGVKMAGYCNVTGIVSVDTIAEHTAASGVTIDGALLKDKAITLATGDTALGRYKEGTWTPALGVVEELTGSWTYTAQNGYYTRIGNIVVASFNVTWSAKPSAGNILTLTLPIATSATAAKNISTGAVYTDNVTYTPSTGSAGTSIVITPYATSASLARFDVCGSGVDQTDQRLIGVAALGTAGSIKGTLTYLVD